MGKSGTCYNWAGQLLQKIRRWFFMNENTEFKARKFKGNNIIWILIVFVAMYMFFASTVSLVCNMMLRQAIPMSPAMNFITNYYTSVIFEIIILVIMLYAVKKNRFILRSFLPEGSAKDFPVHAVEDTYVAQNRNSVKMLLIGAVLGFVTNFTCILCALAHGDIKLYFDFSASQLPVLLFALLSVFIQSTGEELWCRGFLYERVLIHYPLWAAIIVNGTIFGLIHSFNPGVSVLAIAGIAVCGVSYSLVRWYTGSIWVPMGIHTLWNFTQNFLFGLPNSGLVSEVSVFHLGAANGMSNLIYDYEFGVEAAIPALLTDLALGIAALLLARRDGRLGELSLSYEKMAAAKKATAVTETAAETDQ